MCGSAPHRSCTASATTIVSIAARCLNGDTPSVHARREGQADNGLPMNLHSRRDARPAFHGEEAFRHLVESVQDYAIFMLSPQGNVATWNVGAQRIKGYEADEIIGQHFSQFYPAEAIASGWPDLELQRAGELGRFEDEGWRIRKDGSRFWANVIITAMRSASGELLGFLKITRDLSERRAHEEHLRRSEENLRLLIDGVQDYAIFRLDPQGIVASWNTGAQRIKGYAASEIIGQHFSRFYREDDIRSGWPAGRAPDRRPDRALRERRLASAQ